MPKNPVKKYLTEKRGEVNEMGKINVLSFAVANLIAAGEVVDRPASVIKELMENSIDAGASRITVEIQHGGVALMRVTDNGCGIEPDDLPTALRRHATSKIKDATDLDAIISLGFRGEALAAISSVSRVRIISKPKERAVGGIIECDGGNIVDFGERGTADGTTVIVEELFYNVPARRKFLKKDAAETMAVTTVVEKIALSHPEIAVRFIADCTTRLETSGDGKLVNAIYAVYGRDFTSRLIHVDTETDGIKVRGYIGRSDNVRSSRGAQNFFINGRYVKCKTAMAATEQAYSSYIPPEKFPCTVLFVDIDPRLVDVNVHPSKLEIKFSNEKPVFDAVYYAVRNALENNVTRPEMKLGGDRISAEEYRKLSQGQKNGGYGDSYGTGGSYRQNFGTGYAKNEPKYETKRVVPNAITSFVPIEDRSAPKPEQLKYNVPARHETDGATGTTGETVAIGGTKKPIKIPEGEAVRDNFRISDKRTLAKGEIPHSNIDVRRMIERTDAFYEDLKARMERSKTQNAAEEAPKNSDNTRTIVPEERVTFAPREGAAYITDSGTHTEKTQETREENICTRESKSVKAYRIMGEAFNSYIFIDTGEKVLVVDKHAAHERLIFEHFKEIMHGREQGSQMLLLPIEVTLGREQCAAVERYRDEIESAGFSFDISDDGLKVCVKASPTGIETDALPDIFETFGERLADGTGSTAVTREIVFEKALYQASCKAAIKAGRVYTDAHTEWLCRKLMENPDITFCPHGRPVAIEMTKNMLDKQFERI